MHLKKNIFLFFRCNKRITTTLSLLYGFLNNNTSYNLIQIFNTQQQKQIIINMQVKNNTITILRSNKKMTTILGLLSSYFQNSILFKLIQIFIPKLQTQLTILHMKINTFIIFKIKKKKITMTVISINGHLKNIFLSKLIQ